HGAELSAALVGVEARELSQQIADQEDRLVGNPVGQLLHAAGDLLLFEERKRAAKIADFAAAGFSEALDLLPGESQPPERAPLALLLECEIEVLEAAYVLELPEIQFASGSNEVNGL